LKTKFGGNNQSSKIVVCEVEECIASLIKTGFPVNPTWMDQNCCYWYRKYGRDDNRKTYFSLTRMGMFSYPYAQGVIKLEVFRYNSS
jgi:hypothetical protein